jgi:hypothetical protein
MLLCFFERIFGGKVLGVHIVSYGLRAYAEKLLVDLHRPDVVLHGLDVLHVPDVLADESMVVTGQAKGALLLGPAGQQLVCSISQVNWMRGIAPGPADELRTLVHNHCYTIIISGMNVPIMR